MSSRFEYKKTKSSFYERQKIRYILPYVLIILVLLVLLAFAFERYETGRSRYDIGMDLWHYIVLIILIPVPLLTLLIRSRLDVIIDEDGLMYRWAPYDKRFHLLHWSAIKEVMLLDMKREGILWRLKKQHGKRFFLGAKYGIEVHLKNGKTVLFSTRKPDEMHRSLTRNAGDKFNLESSTVVFDYS